MPASKKVVRETTERGVEELEDEGETFTVNQVKRVARKLGRELSKDIFSEIEEKYGWEEFRVGLGVEMEHGPRDPDTDVTGGDLILTAKIALAHLREFPNYYHHLIKMERRAKKEQSRVNLR